VLCAAVGFVLALALVLAAKLVGLIHASPPGPVRANAIPPHGTGIAILAVLACTIVLCLLVLRPILIRLGRLGAAGLVPDQAAPGAAAGLLLALCAVTLAIWLSNPFAAALIVPALHFWLWVVAPDPRLRPALRVALIAGGFAAPVLVIVYYALALGLGPVALAWNAVLLVAGGHVGLLAAVEWSIVLGCGVSLLLIAPRRVRQAPVQERPVTIRGPVTYAGPGSLGGTKSALRR
jgi:hypothetical protein